MVQIMNSKKHYIIPIFVPFFGCPNHCIFCDQEKITGINERQEVDVEKVIDSYLETISQNSSPKHIEVAFYGGSFTGLPFSVQHRLLATAASYKKQEKIDGIRLSTRPDFINQDILELLQEQKVTTIELGVQSLDDQVLQAAHRGHSSQDVYQAVHLIKANNIKVGIQLMVGLPEDTPAKTLDTAKKVVVLKPELVRIYPTLVLKGTELATLYQKGLYRPWSIETTVAVCKELYYLFTQNQIPIIRLGLQHTEELKEEHFLAGPYHSAMGELVQGAVFLDMIFSLLKKYKSITNEKEIVIYCAPQDLSKVRGHKNINIKTLKQSYQSIDIIIKASHLIKRDYLGISNTIVEVPEFLINKQEFIGSQRI